MKRHRANDYAAGNVAAICRDRCILAGLPPLCRVGSRQLCRRIVWRFPEMATELADLVIAGIKRATASLARDYCEVASRCRGPAISS